MEGDGFGGVAISGNGKIMAVSAHGADINGFLDAGYVRLFDKDGTDWNMLQQINGSYASHRFGYSIDLSHDGSMLGIGAYTGPAYMYEFSNTSSLYESIYTTSIVDVTEVSVSGDGSTFGVTFTTGWTKYARIFGRVGAGFQQRGSPINGYGRWRSGIALNYDGTIAAIGDRAWSLSRGRFGVFQWRDGNGDGSKEWIQMGSPPTGNYVDDYFAYVGGVSITYDGLTVAIGAPFWGSDNKGLVRVYNYAATTNTWVKVLDRVGDNSGDELHHTSLSSDGKYLAIGSRQANFLFIFQKNGSNYEIVGNKVTSGEEGRFGQSIDMSADGGVVATSNPQFDNNRGRAYLLIRNNQNLTPSPLPSFVPTELPTQTPSSATTKPSSLPSALPSFDPTAAASKTDFTLTFLSVDTSFDFDGTNPDKEIIIKTLISNKAPRESFEQTILVGIDCQSKLVDEYPNDTTLISISNNETLDVVEGKSTKVTSEVNIDTATIAAKGTHTTDPDNKSIYSEYEEDGEKMAKIEFCIRTDYGKTNVTDSDGNIIESSVNFYKVKVTVTFLMQIGFTSANVSIAEAEESKTEQAGTITAEVNACNCPAIAASKEDCIATPVEYSQNDILSACVYDPTENAFITSFKDVTLGNGQISTLVIGSDGKPTTLSSIGRLNEDMAIVNTRIVSAFFAVGDGIHRLPSLYQELP